MRSEDYNRIEELFHAALEEPPTARAAFLKRVCGADEELCREVESLLSFDDRASRFIEEPPGELAAALLSEEHHSRIGQTLGHYQILSSLGSGGMGEVYLADDKKLGRNVALKVMRPESTADSRAKKRLLREAQAAAKLDHPNICAIHEVGEEQGEAFIVMQFVEGTTLAERMREKPLVLNEALDISIQVADALSEAHSRGIIHRDIKPQNIMVTSRGQAKVMDFGLATMTRAHSALDSMSETASFSTEQGVIAGTIPYMSPEQVKGEQLDVRSDIFSFGVLLYEITAGVNPFEASSLAETISAILTTKPAPLGSYSYDVPDDLQRVVDRCLEKNKENRYQSTGELVAVLRQLRLEVSSGSATRIAARKQNKLRLLTALILIVLALGSVFLFWFFHNSAPKRDIRSLLIMPFVNASNDPDVEYLSDGISESLINSISQLSELKVIARTTAFRYKGSEADPKQIGRDLDVDAVMTGRVTQQGDSLVVQADLLNTADGSEIWGAKYSKKLSDVFAVQEQIAREITANLRFKITGEESQALSKRYTANIKAYQDYMIGYNYLQRRTGPDFFTAISYFEAAIKEEPNYALAYAALTEAYISMTVRGLVDGVEGRRKAEECARKALSCDQNLAEAHVAIAQLYADFPPYNFSESERELKHALKLSPNMAQAYLVLAASLVEQGRLDEAVALWIKARELDPLSAIIARLEAFTYLCKRDYTRAFDLLADSKVLAPPFIIWGEAEIYTQNGKTDELRTVLNEAKRERGDDSYVILGNGLVAAVEGKRSEVLQAVKKLELMSGASLHRAVLIAMLYSALREKESTLSWLERGLQAQAITIFYKDAPIWDSVRSDKRFQDLLNRMGLSR